MKIGPIELHCDFDASQYKRRYLWQAPVNFYLGWPGFRWSFGLDTTRPKAECNQRWFRVLLEPLDDCRVGPRWLFWRMGYWRLYWWFGFRVEKTNG